MPLRGAIAALATRHGKERAIAPVLARLGLEVRVAAVDTDRFGTLEGEVPRLSTPLATANAKVRAALAAMSAAEFAVASVGTFEPLPGVGMADQELILLVHREGRMRVTGMACAEVRQLGAVADRVTAAQDAAGRLGFPASRVILIAAPGGRPTPLAGVARDLRTVAELRDAAADFIARHGSACVEPDRRADRNPERMHVIARAAEDLERQWHACLQWPPPASTERDRLADGPRTDFARPFDGSLCNS